MNGLSSNPIITYSNCSDFHYNICNINNNNSNTRMYLNNFFRHSNCRCNCHCHYHNRSHHISYSNIDYQNQQKKNIEKKYNHMPIRNKSMNNLLHSVDKNNFDDIKKKYQTNNNYNDIINKYKRNSAQLKTDSYINHNFKNISFNNNNPKIINANGISNINNISRNGKNIEINDYNSNYNIYYNKKNNYNFKSYKHNKFTFKPLKKSLYIKRKELSKYFHVISPKKYSYGGQNLETSNTKNNHQYKEVVKTSYSTGKNSQKSRVINYNEFNDDNTFCNDKLNTRSNTEANNINNNIKDINNINNINNIKSINKGYNYHYISCQNSPQDRNRTSYIPNTQPNEGKIRSKSFSRIIKETHNTRLVDSKDLSSLGKNLYSSNTEKNSGCNTQYNSNINSNINNISNLSNDNGINNNNISSNNNYYKLNNYTNKNKNMPKSYSLNDLNNYTPTNPYNINHINNYCQNEIDYLNNIKKENKIDYEMIKLKVKLALLEKEKFEQQKNKNKISNNEKNKIKNDYLKRKNYLEQFLNKTNKKPTITRNNTLLEKTKKLLEEKKAKNAKKDKDDINKTENYNNHRILYSLHRNLKTKNNDYNKNIVRPNIKMNSQ